MMKRILALGLVLALVGTAWAEPTYTKVSATQAVTNTTLPANTMTVVVINDGPNEAYVRLFTSGETAVDATTSSLEIKVGEAFAWSYHPSSTDKAGGYYKTLSIICAGGETATVRVESK